MSCVRIDDVEIDTESAKALVAAVPIAVGTVVVDCDDSEIQAKRTFRTIQIGLGRHIRNTLIDYVNHSCSPNTLFDTERLELVAIRNIAAGEKITFFYPGAEVELAHSFICQCGSPECLKEIRGGFYLTLAQMRWAVDRRYCTKFMRKNFLNLLNEARR